MFQCGTSKHAAQIYHTKGQNKLKNMQEFSISSAQKYYRSLLVIFPWPDIVMWTLLFERRLGSIETYTLRKKEIRCWGMLAMFITTTNILLNEHKSNK